MVSTACGLRNSVSRLLIKPHCCSLSLSGLAIVEMGEEPALYWALSFDLLEHPYSSVSNLFFQWEILLSLKHRPNNSNKNLVYKLKCVCRCKMYEEKVKYLANSFYIDYIPKQST